MRHYSGQFCNEAAPHDLELRMLLRTLSARFLGPRSREGVARAHWVGALVQAQRSALMKAATDEGLTPDEALDCVQDAAATLLSRADWSTLEGDDARRLALTVVRNHARNGRRRHWRQDVALEALPESLEADGRALDEAVEEAERHLLLTGCISTLKATQRAVVVARFFEGSSGAQVAQALGLSAGNVAVTLHRARQQLKECLVRSRSRYGLD
jgi:RNA polymerase sigma-70 factor (ECF subfamily)